MIYQFILFDHRDHIIEHKDFSELDEDKLMDYASSRLDKLKDCFRFEIKRFDHHDMPTKKP